VLARPVDLKSGGPYRAGQLFDLGGADATAAADQAGAPPNPVDDVIRREHGRAVPAPVRTHVDNILGKLDVHSRAEAVDVAHRHGLLAGVAAPTA
jgi:hypothetical protein